MIDNFYSEQCKKLKLLGCGFVSRKLGRILALAGIDFASWDVMQGVIRQVSFMYLPV